MTEERIDQIGFYATLIAIPFGLFMGWLMT